jgi:hypothetical protein
MTDQPAAYNLLRLSFDTHRDYLAYEEANRGRLHLIWSWHEGFGNRDVPFQVPGICDLCDRPTAFEAVPCRAAAGDPFAFRVPWRLSMTCACGLPALHRAVLRALLTFPFLGGAHYDHLVRAEKLPDGSIRHLAAPEYHDDPANPDGILSFRAFGWKILDEIRDAGFARASVRYLFGPLHGHLSLVASPIVVAVR